MRRDSVEEAYRRHHERSRDEGFVFGGPERLPLFREWVGGPGLRVLDLGCRDGALTSAYLAGNRVVGVDVDRGALVRAAERGIETVWADLDEDLPFDDASFDAVVVAEVLEHLRLPEHVLSEVERVLVPGGVLVGSVPNCFRLKTRCRFLLGRPPENDPTLLHMLRPSDMAGLLGGFEHVEVRCVAGRLVRLHPRLFANDIVFRARKPERKRQSVASADTNACSPAAARTFARQLAAATREHVVAATLFALLFLVLLFVALPEELGDWPYNALGH
jgi:SAM-dependent methyltransferase